MCIVCVCVCVGGGGGGGEEGVQGGRGERNLNAFGMHYSSG